MKKTPLIVWIIVAAAIAIFLLLLVANPGSTFIATSAAVQIPMALQLALTAFLFGLLTIGFKFIMGAIGLDLTSYATPLSGTLSAFLIGIAQQWINLQPVSSDPLILMILNVAVVIVGGIGSYAILTRRG
jgi:hypothetical protein